MPAALHQIFETIIMRWLKRLVATGIIPLKEDEFIFPLTGPKMTLTYEREPSEDPEGSKPQSGICKLPDIAIHYGDPSQDCLECRIVFEVGFSQSYDDLIYDMKRYFQHGPDTISAVVLIKITEDTSRNDELKACREAFVDKDESVACSRDYLLSATTEEWVGDIHQLFVEIWRRDPADGGVGVLQQQLVI